LCERADRYVFTVNPPPSACMQMHVACFPGALEYSTVAHACVCVLHGRNTTPISTARETHLNATHSAVHASGTPLSGLSGTAQCICRLLRTPQHQTIAASPKSGARAGPPQPHPTCNARKKALRTHRPARARLQSPHNTVKLSQRPRLARLRHTQRVWCRRQQLGTSVLRAPEQPQPRNAIGAHALPIRVHPPHQMTSPHHRACRYSASGPRTHAAAATTVGPSTAPQRVSARARTRMRPPHQRHTTQQARRTTHSASDERSPTLRDSTTTPQNVRQQPRHRSLLRWTPAFSTFGGSGFQTHLRNHVMWSRQTRHTTRYPLYGHPHQMAAPEHHWLRHSKVDSEVDKRVITADFLA